MKRRGFHGLLLLACLTITAGGIASSQAELVCATAAADFCVCCPPAECRKEESYCPGGVAGLILLKAENRECAVNPYEAASCRSGGMIASERRSALSVYVQGQSARIDMSDTQLDELLGQLRELRQ